MEPMKRTDSSSPTYQYVHYTAPPGYVLVSGEEWARKAQSVSMTSFLVWMVMATLVTSVLTGVILHYSAPHSTTSCVRLNIDSQGKLIGGPEACK